MLPNPPYSPDLVASNYRLLGRMKKLLDLQKFASDIEVQLALREWLGQQPALLFTARSSYASAVLEIVILSVCLSVRPSVTHVLCDERKEHTADILISHERDITLVF